MDLPDYPDVPLREAPLETALAQVRFSREPQLEDEISIRPIREALKDDYPVYRITTESGLMVAPDGTFQQGPSVRLWNFTTLDDSWTVVITPEFLSLQTRRYQRISEFAERFEKAVDILDKLVHPPRQERFGLRYLNALHAQSDMKKLLEMVNPTLRGLAGSGVVDSNELGRSLTENALSLGNAQILFRYGLLGPGPGLDITPAFSELVFLLDIDMFEVSMQKLDAGSLASKLRQFHSWIYRLFRWSLSDLGYGSLGPDDASIS